MSRTIRIEYDDYYKMKQEMDEQRATMLWIDFIFGQLLTAILITTFPRRDKRIRSMVNKFSIMQRATLLYALKLIDKTALDDIKLIRDIRNKFAHDIPSKTFAADEICALCGRLSTAKDQKLTAKNSFVIYIRAAMKQYKQLQWLSLINEKEAVRN